MWRIIHDTYATHILEGLHIPHTTPLSGGIACKPPAIPFSETVAQNPNATFFLEQGQWEDIMLPHFQRVFHATSVQLPFQEGVLHSSHTISLSDRIACKTYATSFTNGVVRNIHETSLLPMMWRHQKTFICKIEYFVQFLARNVLENASYPQPGLSRRGRTSKYDIFL